MRYLIALIALMALAVLALTIPTHAQGKTAVSANEYVSVLRDCVELQQGHSSVLGYDVNHLPPEPSTLQDWIYFALTKGVNFGDAPFTLPEPQAVANARMKMISIDHPGGIWERLSFKEGWLYLYTYKAEQQMMMGHWILQLKAGDAPASNGLIVFAIDEAHPDQLWDVKIKRLMSRADFLKREVVHN